VATTSSATPAQGTAVSAFPHTLVSKTTCEGCEHCPDVGVKRCQWRRSSRSAMQWSRRTAVAADAPAGEAGCSSLRSQVLALPALTLQAQGRGSSCPITCSCPATICATVATPRAPRRPVLLLRSVEHDPYELKCFIRWFICVCSSIG
jgi:hypothetical protein